LHSPGGIAASSQAGLIRRPIGNPVADAREEMAAGTSVSSAIKLLPLKSCLGLRVNLHQSP